MKLNVIHGPMFSGKTKALLELIRQCPDPDRLVFKHLVDDSRCHNRLSCHDAGLTNKIDAISIGSLYQVLEYVTTETRAAFVDEVQFFDPATSLKAIAMLRESFPELALTVCGLDLDFKGKPWQTMLVLKGTADHVQHLVGHCAVCDDPATHSFLKAGSPAPGSLVLTGGAEKYEPRCLRCHTRGLRQEVSL